ncbi:uncharacterized protein LOC132705918 isoform X2 [Cylas formicarius]|uniref:uncharacterized protein LOC132705918 isoform X2 n=1 Tax=Cylas formicarius TaxID=197179 RepID=UPI00295847A4|nr:uncharacterized protein LOC132705918 isoform X2 [Cylas formicarius]
MALRNCKITSEIIQNCNRIFSSKHDMSTKTKPMSLETQTIAARQSFRYRIANLERPQDLPEINFPKEEITQFSELQPSAKPLFRFEYNQAKWIERPEDRSPFPQSIKALRSETQISSDRQKAEEKILRAKGLSFVPLTRNYSIGVERTYGGKNPSENNSEGKCGKNKLKRDCTAQRPQQKSCGMNDDCPRHKLHDCEQSKGSNCKLNYLDPHCTKKMAPYPSYSESCAEQLVEDPSECTQCPWRICDGADTIEPQKNKSKRRYSTNASRYATTADLPIRPPSSGSILPSIEDIDGLICDVRKPPCNPPQSPCDIRRQLEEELKRKEMEKKYGNKERNRKRDGENNEQRKAMQLEPLGEKNVSEGVEDALMLSEQQKKRKHPNCHKNRPGKRPVENKINWRPKCHKPVNRKNRNDPKFY